MKTPIKKVLISVSDKSNIEDLAKFLNNQNMEIFSTGGTAKKLIEQGIPVKDISVLTGFPEILDGRVKTLHPKVHGGLLAKLDDKTHRQEMSDNGIESIDLIIVNLYPFVETLAKGASKEEIIENIDIGGPSMLRSAAKNYHFTTIVTDPNDYSILIEEIKNNAGATSLEFRFNMAKKAFNMTANYDAAISNWFNSLDNTVNDLPENYVLSGTLKQNLRYGENPHQNAAFYTYGSKCGIAASTQLQGKELSYNNINDADSALQIVMDFIEPTAVVVKHANPCGAAFANTIEEAYDKALACDPVSAFGGILAFNRPVTIALAEKISPLFAEAIIAPSVEPQALEILAKKKNLRILICDMTQVKNNSLMVKSVLGGFLVQDIDKKVITKDDTKLVSKRVPNEQELNDLVFAFKICKHVKSNAIVIVKNSATIGIGAGQMSRVDSVKIALMKANSINANLNGAVLASDAFFPFPDSVTIAANAGIKALIQTSGSIRDNEVIQEADKLEVSLLHTDIRHFKH